MTTTKRVSELLAPLEKPRFTIIIEALRKSGPCLVRDLAKQMNIPYSDVSNRMKYLRDSGAVKRVSQTDKRCYVDEMRMEHLQKLSNRISEICIKNQN